MLVEGEVSCLHCGASSGTWVGPKGSTIRGEGLRGELPVDIDRHAPLRCRRCGGPVMLEGAAPAVSRSRLQRIQRMREQLAEMRREKGRAA